MEYKSYSPEFRHITHKTRQSKIIFINQHILLFKVQQSQNLKNIKNRKIENQILIFIDHALLFFTKSDKITSNTTPSGTIKDLKLEKYHN